MYAAFAGESLRLARGRLVSSLALPCSFACSRRRGACLGGVRIRGRAISVSGKHTISGSRLLGTLWVILALLKLIGSNDHSDIPLADALTPAVAWGELALGLSLLAPNPMLRLIGLWLSVIAAVTFIVMALAADGRAGCGCFGGVLPEASWIRLVVASAMLLLAASELAWGRRGGATARSSVRGQA